MTSSSNDNQKTVQCVLCSKTSVAEYAPFCSKRCADVDLHRWLTGSYAIPDSSENNDETLAESDEAF